MTTMRVTMTRTTMGEAGSLLTAGSTYTVSRAFGAYLVGQAKSATDPDGTLAPLGSEPLRLATNPVTGASYAVDGAGNVAFRRTRKVKSVLGSLVVDLVAASGMPAGASFSGTGSYNSANIIAVQSTGTVTHNPTGWYDGTACIDFVPNTDSAAEFRIHLGAGAAPVKFDNDSIAFRFGIPELDTSKSNFSVVFEYSSDAVSLFPSNRASFTIWRDDNTTATTKERAGEKYIRQRWDHDTTDANAGAWPGIAQGTSGTGSDRTANIPYIKFHISKMSGKTVKFKSIINGGFSTPCIVIGSDNGTPEALASKAFAYMANKGLDGYITQYLDAFNNPGTLDRVRRIYDAGFEHLGDDTVDRPLGSSVTDEAQMRSAVETTRDTLNGLGFTRGNKVWVANNNSTSALMVRELARAGYVANRNGSTDGRFVFPEGGVKDPFRMPAISLDQLNAATIQTHVDRVITYGATLWLYFHGVISSAQIDADRTANITGTVGAPIARSGSETVAAYRARALALGTGVGNASVAYFDARIGTAALGVWWEELQTALDYIVSKKAAGALVVASPEDWCRDVGLL